MNKIIKQKIIQGIYDGEIVQEFGITHFKYENCDTKYLVKITNEDFVHEKCAKAFEKMQKKAENDGIKLFIVSGFRSKKEQIEVFKYKFKDKNKKY